MPKLINRIGQTYGPLTIVAQAPGRDPYGKILWRCNCSCGKRGSVISNNHLKTAKSCGRLCRYRISHKGKALTQARLQQVLRYDSETGTFFWRTNKSASARMGDRAGYINNEGYWVTSVDNKMYLSHRLAWLYVYGYFPKELDHKNRDRSDCRITNLREATRRQTRANSKAWRKNCTGLRGVRQNGRHWQAAVKNNGKCIYLGTFDTKEEAHKAYCQAAREIYGEFFHDGKERETA